MRKTKMEHDINAYNFLCEVIRTSMSLKGDGSVIESMVLETAGFVLMSDPIIGFRLRKFVAGEDMSKALFKQTVGRITRCVEKYMHEVYLTVNFNDGEVI